MNHKDALVLVMSRNAFYKRLHYLALAAFGLMIIAIAVLAFIVIYLVRNPTPPLYFATDNVGRLIQVLPVSMPNMSTDDVTRWTVKAVEAAYSFDYINYHAQLQSAQKYFTSYGWTSYMEALKLSNNLLGIKQRKMVGIAKVVEKPTITAQGILSGAYAWKFEMPVLVVYLQPPYDDSTKIANALKVSVVVQRQPALQGDQGLGIVQMIGSR